MDKLARQLRNDADEIEFRVSDELDDRIRASLENMRPEAPRQPRKESRPVSFWWASSLTGVAAAIAAIVVVNLDDPVTDGMATEPAPQALVIPSIQWNVENAVLTSPLEQELENLQSDLEKAEDAVKQDIDRLF